MGHKGMLCMLLRHVSGTRDVCAKGFICVSGDLAHKLLHVRTVAHKLLQVGTVAVSDNARIRDRGRDDRRQAGSLLEPCVVCMFI